MAERIDVEDKVGKWKPEDGDENGADKKAFLDFLLKNCRGFKNARAIETIRKQLWPGKQEKKEALQHRIIVPLRQQKDIFVGTCHRGVYLVETAEDAVQTINFYTSRIRSEQKHLRNLKRIVSRYKLTVNAPARRTEEAANIFFDESGTPSLGDADQQPYFIVSAILVDGKRPTVAIQKKFIGLRAELGKREDFEFKASKLKRKEYENVLTGLGTMDFEFISVCFVKKRLTGEGFKYPTVFYKYAFKFLTSNVLDYVNHANLRFDTYGGKGSIFEKEFFEYIEKQNMGYAQSRVKQLEMVDSRGDSIVQLADLICGAVKRSAEGDNGLLDLLQDKAIDVIVFPFEEKTGL